VGLRFLDLKTDLTHDMKDEDITVKITVTREEAAVLGFS
jgi:hypothetical protein